MHKNLLIIFSALTFLSASLACKAQKNETKFSTMQLKIHTAKNETVMLTAEIAHSDVMRAEGFMHREHIPDGTGMLFVFPRDEYMSFWMKNTPSALSIAFIDSAGYIREIYSLQPKSTQATLSKNPARYALEVPEGWFTRAGIAVGDKLSKETLDALPKGE